MTSRTRNRRTVLITGASSGIGADLARIFAREGHDLILVARSRNRLDEIASQLREAHAAPVQVAPVDLSVLGAASALHERVAREGWAVDVLVNNAGFGMRGSFVDLDPARQLEMIQVNLVAVSEPHPAVLAGDGAARDRSGPQRGLHCCVPA